MQQPAELDLPEEAPDVTATDAHYRVLGRLFGAVRFALHGRALVLADIFLRVDGRVQVSPDLIVAPNSTLAEHRVYRVPDEPVPIATVEVLSELNRRHAGRELLEQKRRLLGEIGVPTHIEIDPDDAFVTVWESRGGQLVRVSVSDRYEGAALGGVVVETPAPGVVRVLQPGGREVLDVDEEIRRAEMESIRADTEAARADTESARAHAEEARADGEAARAERLAARLRLLGVDPDEA